MAGKRFKRIVRNLRTFDGGNVLVQQASYLAGDPGFGLAPQAEQDDVVAGEHGPLHIGNDRFLVSDHPGKNGFLALHFPDQVGPDFVFDAAGSVSSGFELTEGFYVE